jgi:hypothetical protein
MYQNENIYANEKPDQGVDFYSFDKDIVKSLTNWLKTFIAFREIKSSFDPSQDPVEQDPRAKVLGKGAVEAFKRQTCIVDELESTRAVSAEQSQTNKQITMAKNSSSFFNCNNVAKVAAAGLLAVGVGLTVVNRFTN